MIPVKNMAAFFLSTLLLCAGPARAQDDNTQTQGSDNSDTHYITPENANRLPPGMEMRHIGGINMMVPQGTQFYTEGSQLKMEEASEYSARMFQENDVRLKKIEARQDKLEEELKELRAQSAQTVKK